MSDEQIAVFERIASALERIAENLEVTVKDKSDKPVTFSVAFLLNYVVDNGLPSNDP